MKLRSHLWCSSSWSIVPVLSSPASRRSSSRGTIADSPSAAARGGARAGARRRPRADRLGRRAADARAVRAPRRRPRGLLSRGPAVCRPRHWSTILLVDPTGQQRSPAPAPARSLPSAGDRPGVPGDATRRPARRPASHGAGRRRPAWHRVRAGDPRGRAALRVAATLAWAASDTLLRQAARLGRARRLADRDQCRRRHPRGAGALGQRRGRPGPRASTRPPKGCCAARPPRRGGVRRLRPRPAVGLDHRAAPAGRRRRRAAARSMWGLLERRRRVRRAGLPLLTAALFARRLARPIAAVAPVRRRLGRGEAPETTRRPGSPRSTRRRRRSSMASGAAARPRRRARARAGRAAAGQPHAGGARHRLAARHPGPRRAGGIVHRWNPACERIFGWTADEVVGAFASVRPRRPAHEFRANVDATLRGRGMRGMETRRPAGRHAGRRQRVDGRPAGEDGRPAYVLAIIDDVTDRRRADRHRIDPVRREPRAGGGRRISARRRRR